MFKFLHAADIHLDSPLRGLSAYEGAPVDTLRGATRAAFRNLVDLTIREEAAFLIIAGDLYDGTWRDYQTGLFFVNEMARLRSAGIRAFVLYGNHDAESEITKRLRLPDNVSVFPARAAKTYMIDDLNVALHGRSFQTSATIENLVPTYPEPVAGRLNVGVLHTALEGNTEHQRKIAVLERQLANAMSDSPRILAEFGTLESPKDSFDCIVPLVQPLSEIAQQRLTAAYLERHPSERMAEDPFLPGVSYAYSIGADTPASFNRKVDEYESAVRKYFASLHKTLFQASRAASLEYVVKNDSGVAAKGLRIEVSVQGSMTLFADDEDADSFYGPLIPPKKPVRASGRPFDYLSTVNAMNRPRDPTRFYWFNRPEYGSTESALQCEDYRPTRLREDDIWIGVTGQLPLRGTVTLEVSATNLPVPITRSASVFMEIKRLEWSDPVLKTLVPPPIRAILSLAAE